MRFQKILILVSLIVAALSFVFALGFCGGTIYQYQTLYDIPHDEEYVEGARDLFNAAQGHTGTLIALTIAFIVIVALNYATATQKRRNYYVTNYISIILTVVYAVVLAIIMFVFISDVQSLMRAIDKEAAEAEYSMLFNDFKYSEINFILGYIVAVIVILDAIMLTLNLVWKTLLMRGEKKLLKGLAPVENAQSTEEVA